jgi:hypothetical protein
MPSLAGSDRVLRRLEIERNNAVVIAGKLSKDPRRSPLWVFLAHPSDEIAPTIEASGRDVRISGFARS